jgi:hypothetical protein
MVLSQYQINTKGNKKGKYMNRFGNYAKYSAVSVVWLFVFALFPYNEANAQCAYSVAYVNPLVSDYAPGCAPVVTTPVFGVADSVAYVPHLYSNYLPEPTSYRVVYSSRTLIRDYRPLAYRYAYYRPRVYLSRTMIRDYSGAYYRPRVYYRNYYRPRVYYGSYYRPHYRPFGARHVYIRRWR